MAQQQVESKPAPAAGSSANLWEACNTGRKTRPDMRFQNAEELWDCAYQYFKWCEKNPILKEKLSTFEGTATTAAEPQPRMPTWLGFIAYTGLTRRTVEEWSKEGTNVYRSDLAPMIMHIKDIINDTKLVNGYAGTVNAMLVARDLELGDKIHMNQELHTLPNEEKRHPNRVANIMHPDATPEYLDKWYAVGKEPPMFTQEQLDAGMELPPAPEPPRSET